MDKKERNLGLDLLRIILAFMVLSLHFFARGTGQVLIYATEIPWKWIAGGLTTLCYPAVNAYILISGFFLSSQNKNMTSTIKSLIKMWMAIMFYSVFGYFAVEVIFQRRFDLLEMIKRFFPISRGTWWFFSVYFSVVLLSPFINKMLHSLSRHEHKMLLLILVTGCSVIPMFTNWESHLGVNNGYSLLWFVALYLSGAYISKYCYREENISVSVFIRSIICYVVISFISYCASPIMNRFGITFTQAQYNSVCTYLQAVVLVWGFLHLPVYGKFSSVISKISAISMASYLFHCQEDIESILWSGIEVWKYANSGKMIPAYFGTLLGLFVLSTIIEMVRIKCVKINGFEHKFITNIVNLGKRFFGEPETHSY